MDSKIEEKNKRRLNKSKIYETDESGKTKLGNLNSFFRKISKKKNEKSPGLKKPESTDEQTQKSILEKMKSLFRCCRRKTIKDNPSLKKFNYEIKRSDNDTKNLDKSLGRYIKQKLKWVLFLFVIYVLVFGAILSIPITLNHLNVIDQNETKQERFIPCKVFRKVY